MDITEPQDLGQVTNDSYVTEHSSHLVGLTGFYAINLFLAVSLNSLVLFILSRQRELQDSMRFMYQLITWLALSFGILWSLYSALWYNQLRCDIICKVFSSPYHFNRQCLLTCHCAICLNLYLLINRPLDYHAIVTQKTTRIALISTATVNLVTNLIYIPFPGSPVMETTVRLCQNSYMKDAMFYFHLYYRTIPLFFTVIFTTIIYALLFRASWKQRRAIGMHDNIVSKRQSQNMRNSNSAQTDIKDPENPADNAPREVAEAVGNKVPGFLKRNKGVITIFLLTSSLLGTWLPYLIGQLIDNTFVSDKIAVTCTWFQPVIYLLTNAEARNICRKLIGRQPPSLEHLSGQVHIP